MVPAAGDPEQQLLVLRVEDRRADRDIRQVRAAVVGGVDRVDIARPDDRIVLDDALDRAIHGAQMHRHMRCVRHQPRLVVEDRAGEVQPLLDVHGIGGVLECHAHLLGDGHEEVVENLEKDRIGLGADGLDALQLFLAFEDDVILRGHARFPARLDDDGLVRFDQDRRAHEARAGREIGTQEHAGLLPGTVREEARLAPGLNMRIRRGGRRLLKARAAPDRLDADRLDHHRLGAIREPETRAMRRLEARTQRLRTIARLPGDFDRAVRAGIAQVQLGHEADLIRRNALPCHLRDSLAADGGLGLRGVLADIAREWHLARHLPRRADRGEAHAIGREQARIGVDEDFGHAEMIGHEAGVLATCTAEAVECIARHVIAALDRDLLDRVRHVHHGDGDEAISDFLG